MMANSDPTLKLGYLFLFFVCISLDFCDYKLKEATQERKGLGSRFQSTGEAKTWRRLSVPGGGSRCQRPFTICGTRSKTVSGRGQCAHSYFLLPSWPRLLKVSQPSQDRATSWGTLWQQPWACGIHFRPKPITLGYRSQFATDKTELQKCSTEGPRHAQGAAELGSEPKFMSFITGGCHSLLYKEIPGSLAVLWEEEGRVSQSMPVLIQLY